MTYFEYQVLEWYHDNRATFSARLNVEGRAGWELVSIRYFKEGTVPLAELIFKRQATES